MKKSLILLMLFAVAMSCMSQTKQDLMNYLANNVNSLNPIEGVYDVEWHCRYITPFVDRVYGAYDATVIIVRNTEGSYNVYHSSGYGIDSYEFRIASNVYISQLGESNVYNFFYYTSKCRIKLTDNNTHFVAKLQLDNGSACKLIPWMNIAPSVNIYPVYDCIKTYPTQSMYNR